METRSQSKSLFLDRTVSLVRIVNGINKYLTETSDEISVASVGDRSTGKPVAKAGPRPTPTLTLSLVSIPYRDRKWIDIDSGKFSQSCFEVSKSMIRLLRRYESLPRQEDGAVSLRSGRIVSGQGLRLPPTVEAWIAFLTKGGGRKKRFQYCLNPHSSEHFLYFKAIQGYSGGTLVDPTLQDKVLLPDDFADYIYNVGNADDMHSIVQSSVG